MENDLRNFIAALKLYLTNQTFAGLLDLLSAGGKLIADITAILTPKTNASKRLESCPLPTALAGVVPALEAELNLSSIDWSRVLQIIIAALRLLIG